MPTVYDIPANILIRRLAQDLKSRDEIAPPEWAPFVKTGAHKERAPDDADFWIIRTALQQLERAGFIKKRGNQGREMTDIGRSYMDKLSAALKTELSEAIPELAKY